MRRLVPFGRRSAAVEDAGTGTDRRLSISERIEDQTQAGGDVTQLIRSDAAWDSCVARKQYALRRGRHYGRFLTRDEGSGEALRLHRRLLNVIPQSQVSGKPRCDLPRVLHKSGVVEVVQQPVVWRVLLHAG